MNDDLIDDLDLEGDAQAAREEPVDASMLEPLVLDALRLEEEIAGHELAAKNAKKKLALIMEGSIPQIMSMIGLDEIGVAGARLKLGLKAYGTLRNAPDEEEAVQYLELNGLKGGVLTKLVIDFTEDQREQAREVAEGIEEAFEKHPTIQRSISPQTLMAFCRDRFTTDPTFDASKVGVTLTTMAKFTIRP